MHQLLPLAPLQEHDVQWSGVRSDRAKLVS